MTSYSYIHIYIYIYIYIVYIFVIVHEILPKIYICIILRVVHQNRRLSIFLISPKDINRNYQ